MCGFSNIAIRILDAHGKLITAFMGLPAYKLLHCVGQLKLHGRMIEPMLEKPGS